MWKIGLTGSIGSGKSLVGSVFLKMGIPVYHADIEAKRFYEYPKVIQKVISLFGTEVLDGNGAIDKKKLAALVFSDPHKLACINDVIHPLVMADFHCWCDLHHQHPFVIHEAAILYESGFDALFDRIILVTAPQQLRIERVMQRDGISAEAVRQRNAWQWDDEKKLELADFVINNDGKHLLVPAVEAIRQTLLSLN